jgi:hypothetical protein
MIIKYELTKKEVSFLHALTKKLDPNCWSGAKYDADFIEEWQNEILTFSNNHLTENKNPWSDGGYWKFGLNDKGLELQSKYE